MNRSLLAIALSGFLLSVHAATPPPSSPFESMAWPASMMQPPTKGATLGALAIHFEKTTLDQVRHSVSSGTILHRGDAGDSQYWLCYTQVGGHDSGRVWLISDGEMGGQDHRVTMISAQQLASPLPTVDCPSLPTKLQPVSLDVPIWLGSTNAEVWDALGAPSHLDGEWQEFDFKRKIPGECQGGYDFLNWLLIKSDKGHVKAILAGQVTSC